MGNGNDKKDQADAYESTGYNGREVPIWTRKLFDTIKGIKPEIYTDFILNVNPNGSAAPDERFEGNTPGKFAEYQTNPKFQKALEEAQRVAKETGEVVKLEIREDQYGEKEAVLTDENGQDLKGHKPMIIETPGGDHYKPLAKLTDEPADINPDLYDGHLMLPTNLPEYTVDQDGKWYKPTLIEGEEGKGYQNVEVDPSEVDLPDEVKQKAQDLAAVTTLPIDIKIHDIQKLVHDGMISKVYSYENNGKQIDSDLVNVKDEPDLGSKTTAIDNLRGILPDQWFDKAIKPSATDTPSVAVPLETPLNLGGMKEQLIEFNFGDNLTIKPL